MNDHLKRFSLAGQRAMVTGASKGIGAEIAALLAEAGADVAIVGRERAGLAQTAARIAAAGRDCLTIEADLGTVDGPGRAATAALERFGTLDILVNNAGIARIAPLLETTLADWEETQAVNLRAPLLLAQALAPGMIRQRRGKIINVSSQAGVVGIDGHGAYGASKGGLNMLTKVMACEWGAAQHSVQRRLPDGDPHAPRRAGLGRSGQRRTDAGEDSLAALRAADRGGRPGPVPGVASVGSDYRRYHPD